MIILTKSIGSKADSPASEPSSATTEGRGSPSTVSSLQIDEERMHFHIGPEDMATLIHRHHYES